MGGGSYDGYRGFGFELPKARWGGGMSTVLYEDENGK